MSTISITPNSAIDTLARTIWGEARGEGDAGMEAVAAVVMNRAHHPCWWGHDIANVCKTPYQFSAWNANDVNRPKLEAVTGADPVFARALSIAARAAQGLLHDPTNGATSYYDVSMSARPPKWAAGRASVARIGRLIFFRD